MLLYYSFIIPVYNRPAEIEELLRSFTLLDTEDIEYEILIIEDGSIKTALKAIEGYKSQLPVQYFSKPNSGPGDSRNYGMKRAKGNYFIILDSDVLLPKLYLKNVDNYLQNHYVDCFGGADAAHESFTPIQKAINFSMTSFLTTGGIRGKEKSVENFKPRSFNMGLSKSAFLKTQGYAKLKVGEDLDLSLRVTQAGFKTAYIPTATVYHKRRNTWKSFYKQVHKFGKGRPILSTWHPQTFSLVFWFPSLFITGLVLSIILSFWGFYVFLVFYLLYFTLIFISSAYDYHNLKIGFYSVWAVLLQFIGYGLGYLKSSLYIHIYRKKPREAFPELFFE